MFAQGIGMTNTGFMAITTNADVQLLSQALPSPDRERERKREREREIERERAISIAGSCRACPGSIDPPS